jgi:hypothetical protein
MLGLVREAIKLRPDKPLAIMLDTKVIINNEGT